MGKGNGLGQSPIRWNSCLTAGAKGQLGWDEASSLQYPPPHPAPSHPRPLTPPIFLCCLSHCFHCSNPPQEARASWWPLRLHFHAESLSSSSPCPGPFTAGHLGLSCSKQTGRQVLPTGNESGSRFGSQIKKDSEKQDQLHHWLSPLPFVTITAPPLLTFPIHLLMRSFPGVRVSAQGDTWTQGTVRHPWRLRQEDLLRPGS